MMEHSGVFALGGSALTAVTLSAASAAGANTTPIQLGIAAVVGGLLLALARRYDSRRDTDLAAERQRNDRLEHRLEEKDAAILALTKALATSEALRTKDKP